MCIRDRYPGPSRATAGPGETFSRGPPKILWRPSGENIFGFFKWYILAYFIFLADIGAAKRRGARGSLPPYPTLSTGLSVPARWRRLRLPHQIVYLDALIGWSRGGAKGPCLFPSNSILSIPYFTFTGKGESRPFREKRGTANSLCGIVTVSLTRSTLHTVNYPTWSGVFNKLKFDHLLKKKRNKKAQLSLGKTHYTLYSFCCSTDLQGQLFSSYLKGHMPRAISD